VDELLHKAIAIVDQKEREKLYQEAGRIVVSEAPSLFIHNEKWHGTFDKRLKGFRFCPVGDVNEFRWLYWG
jgi:peptide/nickel transport system substrate-binding protein